jgi:hypothetical protein
MKTKMPNGLKLNIKKTALAYSIMTGFGAADVFTRKCLGNTIFVNKKTILGTMNWEKLYDFLLNSNLLNAAIESLENKQNFKPYPGIFETSLVTQGQLEQLVRKYATNDLIKLRFEDKSNIISRLFILKGLKGLQVHENLFRNEREKITFFDSEFVYGMMRASEVSSGFSHFAEAVHDVSNAIENGGANLDGSWYFTEAEFNDLLKKYVHGFEAVYKSVQKINNYINGPYNI